MSENVAHPWRKRDGTYTLTADLRVGDWVIPKGFQSDGCTFPGAAKILKPLMRAGEYVEGCLLHDWLRSYALVSIPEADKLLKRYIHDERGDPWRAHLYWLAVKLGRIWFADSRPLPAKWETYRYPVYDFNTTR